MSTMWPYSPELHLITIAAVNIVSVALTALGAIASRLGSKHTEEDFQETPIVTFITMVVAVATSIVAFYVSGIVGTYKRKKVMLIPFLILKVVLALNFIAIFLYLCIVKEGELVSLKTLYVGLASLGSTVEIYFGMVGLMVYRDMYYRSEHTSDRLQMNLSKPLQYPISNQHAIEEPEQ